MRLNTGTILNIVPVFSLINRFPCLLLALVQYMYLDYIIYMYVIKIIINQIHDSNIKKHCQLVSYYIPIISLVHLYYHDSHVNASYVQHCNSERDQHHHRQ